MTYCRACDYLIIHDSARSLRRTAMARRAGFCSLRCQEAWRRGEEAGRERAARWVERQVTRSPQWLADGIRGL